MPTTPEELAASVTEDEELRRLIAAAIRLAVQQEREACARVADGCNTLGEGGFEDSDYYGRGAMAEHIAKLIRERA